MKLLRTDQYILASDCPSEILTYLRNKHKTYVHGEGSKLELRDPFIVLDQRADTVTISAPEGLHDRVSNWMSARGDVEHTDERVFRYQPQLNLTYGYRFSQKELHHGYLLKGQNGTLEAPTRYGKCLDPTTKLRRITGETVLASELKRGDVIMGPGGAPRTIDSMAKGVDPYFITVHYNGRKRNVTPDHPLTVYDTETGRTQDIEARLLLHQATDYKSSRYRLVSYKHRNIASTEIKTELPIDWSNVDAFASCFMGLSSKAYSDLESDIVRRPLGYRQKLAVRFLGILTTWSPNERASVMRFGENVAYAKWMRTLFYSVGVRPDLRRLGGCLSLCFPASAKRIVLGDNESLTRFKLRRHDTPFSWVGFQLAEDPHFVFDDWVVTHNTTLMVNTCRAYPDMKTVITAPGIDLLTQLRDTLVAQLPGRKVKAIFSGSGCKEQCEDITVVSMDSLEKCDFEGTKLVLIDEPHSVVTDSRGMFLNSFKYARRMGFGATLEGRYDRSDILIEALIGPVLARRTFTEAVAEGAVCPIDVLIVKYPFENSGMFDRQQAYRKVLWQNEDIARIVRRIQSVFPSDWQVLSFISNEDQALYLQQRLPDNAIAMAKRMPSKKDRNAMFSKMASGEITRCIASNIYSTGVTFSNLRCAINMEGGGAFITCVQKPGRLAEVRPGKKSGIMIDFMPCPVEPVGKITSNRSQGDLLLSDGIRRLNVYRKKGYNIHYVSSDPDEVENKLREVANV